MLSNLQALAQQAELPAYNTEAMLMLLERLESDAGLFHTAPTDDTKSFAE